MHWRSHSPSFRLVDIRTGFYRGNWLEIFQPIYVRFCQFLHAIFRRNKQGSVVSKPNGAPIKQGEDPNKTKSSKLKLKKGAIRQFPDYK